MNYSCLEYLLWWSNLPHFWPVFVVFIWTFSPPLASLDHCGRKKGGTENCRNSQGNCLHIAFFTCLSPQKKVFPVPAVLSVLLHAVIRHDLRKEPLQVNYFQKVTFVYHFYLKKFDRLFYTLLQQYCNVEFLFKIW